MFDGIQALEAPYLIESIKTIQHVGRMPKVINTFYFCFIACGIAHQHGSGLAVQGVCWVGVSQQLWQEDFENVDHV